MPSTWPLARHDQDGAEALKRDLHLSWTELRPICKKLVHKQDLVLRKRTEAESAWESCYHLRVISTKSCMEFEEELQKWSANQDDCRPQKLLELASVVTTDFAALNKQKEKTMGLEQDYKNHEFRVVQLEKHFCTSLMSVLVQFGVAAEKHDDVHFLDDSLRLISDSTASVEMPSMVERYFDKVGSIKLMNDKIADLERDHREELGLRELLRDQESRLSQSDSTFEAAYEKQLASLRGELSKAAKMREQAKEECLNAGLDPETYQNRTTSDESADNRFQDHAPTSPAALGTSMTSIHVVPDGAAAAASMKEVRAPVEHTGLARSLIKSGNHSGPNFVNQKVLEWCDGLDSTPADAFSTPGLPEGSYYGPSQEDLGHSPSPVCTKKSASPNGRDTLLGQHPTPGQASSSNLDRGIHVHMTPVIALPENDSTGDLHSEEAKSNRRSSYFDRECATEDHDSDLYKDKRHARRNTRKSVVDTLKKIVSSAKDKAEHERCAYRSSCVQTLRNGLLEQQKALQEQVEELRLLDEGLCMLRSVMKDLEPDFSLEAKEVLGVFDIMGVAIEVVKSAHTTPSPSVSDQPLDPNCKTLLQDYHDKVDEVEAARDRLQEFEKGFEEAPSQHESDQDQGAPSIPTDLAMREHHHHELESLRLFYQHALEAEKVARKACMNAGLNTDAWDPSDKAEAGSSQDPVASFDCTAKDDGTDQPTADRRLPPNESTRDQHSHVSLEDHDTGAGTTDGSWNSVSP